jgi:heme O synthase-like polyprenyltransferase
LKYYVERQINTGRPHQNIILISMTGGIIGAGAAKTVNVVVKSHQYSDMERNTIICRMYN